MQQSRRELVDQVLRLVGETDDTVARTLAEDLINTAILRIWMKHPWRAFQMPSAFTFATVASQRSYPLPAYFGRIARDPAIVRNLTTGAEIRLTDQDTCQALDPRQGTSLETAGTPVRAFIGGSVGVGVQPATAGDALEVVSSSAADTTVKVTVEGLDANGVDVRAEVTLNGTTAVAVATLASVFSFTKAYPDGTTPTTERTSSAGTVTLRKVTGATTLQALLPQESAVDRPQITLHPMPSSVVTIAVPMLRAPRRLIADSDMVPPMWGPAVQDFMVRHWRVSTGELAEDDGRILPALLDLLAFDAVSGGATPGGSRGAGSRSRY